MHIRSQSFHDMQPIPSEFAFGKPGPDGEPCVLSTNRNPHLAWTDVPAGTRAFALSCIDPDVPSVGDDVNQVGRHVRADLPRVEFVHWLMVDIPAECRELGAGRCSDGIVARGKREPVGPNGSRQGLNDYTGWFAGDADMGGSYLGYDGPCPPWNDERLHHYHFCVYALDVPTLGLEPGFTLADFRRAIDGHVLAEARIVGTYTLNAALRR
ncbi:MAG TPA: YbhB/YbcL family Raf kinase inhibitor-like protein [Dokdonella sp.]|uniref:YbhB/YbcL family Raf kinase inhibitor-like protein n=1 Tax=Dokdonella sp. TaxID=2291710 RepID=UPI0025C08E9A|nr:YbhB/YbcL family Raf kinase inhibitor-like protein [Dokdonella sp.]MBX3691405.1 YbhB/YbcL family Raf kinase inhibitor-like protein [Dokdonella sp.]MCW5568457.1 YbhB/YbcL family Raf kinase inhibitor-like protein [Dokdonella sp.]HNR91970.1 YbhB/YbcL family Raf kinase inhibitor-like protein [Dokdonella sp.]